MSCLDAPSDGSIGFVPGDEIVQPFLLLAESTIVDITDCDVSAEVWWFGEPQIELTIAGGGIIIENLAPPVSPTNQRPHGVVILTEEQTLSLPILSVPPVLRIVVVTSGGITSHTQGWYLGRDA